MQDAVAYFAIRLICGTSLVLCAMPRQNVPSPFFRIMMLVALGLSALFAVTSPAGLWWGVALGMVAFVGSVLWLLERRVAATTAMALLSAVSIAAMLVSLPGGESGERNAGTLLVAASAPASAGTLGAAFTGMLLGHRYLTAPGMPLSPLVRVNGYLAGASLLRFLVSAAALAFGFSVLSQPVYWIWLALRWLAGIFGPMAVSVMVHRILRYRNTQAATGVLFVGVILTFIGELTADLLQRALHVAF